MGKQFRHLGTIKAEEILRNSTVRVSVSVIQVKRALLIQGFISSGRTTSYLLALFPSSLIAFENVCTSI